MSIRITCINKSNGYHQDPHHAIQSLGWKNDSTGEDGKSSRLEIYDWLKNKNGSAYVLDQLGSRAAVHPRENSAGNNSGSILRNRYARPAWRRTSPAPPQLRGVFYPSRR